MLTQAERKEQEGLAERKCDLFEEVINQIIYAGMPGSNPFFSLYDNEGYLWWKQPREMNPHDIIEYARHAFGDEFVGFLKSRAEFTVH